MSKELAKHSVLITQIIKLGLNKSPEEVIKDILQQLPELTVQDIIDCLTGVADRLKIAYNDIYDLIGVIQKTANDVIDDLAWNNFWQSLAQGLLYVASLLKNILPKWATIIIAILEAYTELKYGA